MFLSLGYFHVVFTKLGNVKKVLLFYFVSKPARKLILQNLNIINWKNSEAHTQACTQCQFDMGIQPKTVGMS